MILHAVDGRISGYSAGRGLAQSCLTLCDPVEGSLPASAVHGIFQAGVLEWVASSFSLGNLEKDPKAGLEFEHSSGGKGKMY